MTPSRIVPFAALAAVMVLASGCDTQKKSLPHLPFACETRACVCTEVEILVLRKVKEVPVEWKPTGEAFCPQGYVLRLTKEK